MHSSTGPLRIAPQLDQPGLSKGKKTFNSLISSIEVRRKALADWQIASEAYRQTLITDYLPLRGTFTGLQKDLLYALDSALDRHKLSRPEQRWVKALICKLAQELISLAGDDSLKPIYNKHSDTDFDADEADDDGDRDGNVDIDAMSAQDTMAQGTTARAHSQRPKTTKQLEREAKTKAQAQRTNQSIREVYRKLVSSLHPDREPDGAERARKTVLMQRVNQAYGKKDLLQLLELQLELEHIDAASIAGLSEDRLKHFNKVLKRQVEELEQEIRQVEMPLRAQCRVAPNEALFPQDIMPLLKRDIAAMKQNIRHLKQELLVTLHLTAFKAWINAQPER